MPSLFQKALEFAAQVKDPVTAAIFAVVIGCTAFWITFKNKYKTIVLVLVGTRI